MRISDWSSDVCSSDLSSPSYMVVRKSIIEKLFWPMILLNSEAAKNKTFLSLACTIPWSRSGSLVIRAMSSTPRFIKLCSPNPNRSEEHTSELQSLMRISYAVFCLKKKKQKHKQRTQQ